MLEKIKEYDGEKSGNDVKIIKVNAVNAAKLYGLSCMPVEGKRPLYTWEKYQENGISVEELSGMDFGCATGFAALMGPGEVASIDFDKLEDWKEIERALALMKLPPDYRWVVKSGSGKGAHIYFKFADGEMLHKRFGKKAVYKFKAQPKAGFEHLEVRISRCYNVFPSSLHPSGGKYEFAGAEPIEAPEYLNYSDLMEYLTEACELPETPKPVNTEKKLQIKTTIADLEDALIHIAGNLESYDEWIRVGFGLCPLEEVGENLFVNFSKANTKYDDTEEAIRKKFRDLKKDYDGRITAGTIFHIAEQYGWKRKVQPYWRIDEKSRIHIILPRIKKILEEQGFCMYRVDKTYLLVRVVDNVVYEVTPHEVKDFIQKYTDEIPIEYFEGTSVETVEDLLMKKAGQIFSDGFYEFLEAKPLKFAEDGDDYGYFFFKNCFVKVTKKGYEQKEYNELDGCIWASQKLERDFDRTFKRTVMAEFFYNTQGQDMARHNAMRSVIGFLLHRKKKAGDEKAVIFIDEKISDGQYGRSGKGITFKAIGKLRNVVEIDGRNFKFGKSFAFQRVNPDTEVIAFDDAEKGFEFDKLFSVLTDGIMVEKKNQKEMYLEYERAPKVVITTNFTIKGIDDSTLDRQIIIEFTDHYNRKHKPHHEFGKLFFTQWNSEEWNAFDCYMIDCLRMYLENGLQSYQPINLNKKLLVESTCEYFPAFVEENVVVGVEYNKFDLHMQFKDENPDYKEQKQAGFTRWLKTYAKLNDLRVIETHSGKEKKFRFVPIDEEGKQAINPAA
ncbi:MAG: bifunctional DNA primase/polymerase [Ignavibacteriaceae bacterium]|nr:bifunctional DNA primase/polymerase [Ignavibacteriaceae bacterium]